MENRKKAIWISLCVVLIAALLFGAYYMLRGGQKGAKEVSVQVVADGKNLLTKAYHTDAASLSALLEENKLATFKQSSYGRYIIAVCGVTADEGKQQWWHIGYNGADAVKGADELMLNNGDKIVLTLKTGY